MKIEVGDYIKDIFGRIGKVQLHKNGTYFTENFGASSGEIVNCSASVIDLLEKHDIIKVQILEAWRGKQEKEEIFIFEQGITKQELLDDLENGIYKIKLIITKEQVNRNGYEVSL